MIFHLSASTIYAQYYPAKFYNDFRIIKNVDSLERAIPSYKSNLSLYLKSLIELELSRYSYSDKFGQNLDDIYEIATLTNDELANCMYNILLFRSSEKLENLNKLYYCYDYFARIKDTIGVMNTCNLFIDFSQNFNDDIYFSSKKNFEDWCNRLKTYGQKSSNLEVKMMYIVASIKHDIKFETTNTNENIKDEWELGKAALAIIAQNPSLEKYRVSIYLGLAVASDRKDQFDKVLEYTSKIYDLEKNKPFLSKSKAAYNLALAYLNVTDYARAEAHYKEAYEYIKKANGDNLLLAYAIKNQLSYVQYQQDKLVIAFENKIEADSIEKILYQKKQTNKFLELETKYNTEKKELENIALNKEKKDLQRYAMILVGLILVIVGLLFILYRSYIKVKVHEQQLEISNQQIEQDAQFKERLFRIIAHDLRSPITAYSDLAKMSGLLIKKNRIDDLNTVAEKLGVVGNNLVALIDNLLYWSINKEEQRNVKKISVQEVFTELLPIYHEISELRGLKLQADIDNSLSIINDKQAVLLILRNLIDNAIKNTSHGETIYIKSYTSEDGVNIAVINKPNKINPNIVAQIKQLFSAPNHTLLDKNVLGLGLIFIKEFVTANRAYLRLIENSDGTLCFCVTFINNLS